LSESGNLAQRRVSIDVLFAAALYVFALLIYARSVGAVTVSQVLTGEEASVSIRDVMYSVEERHQASKWATNFLGHCYYWLAAHLDPSYSMFSARRWKAVAMALLAPIVYVALRRRLHCGQIPAIVGGVTAALLPGVAMFGWLATENGLEVVLGSLGLLLATSRRPFWLAAPVLAAMAIGAYPSGIAWAAAIGAVMLWRLIREPRGWRNLALMVPGFIVAGGVLLFPVLWWKSGDRILSGGGTVQPELIGQNLSGLWNQLTDNGHSYYYFSVQPGLGSLWLTLAALIAGVLVAVRRPQVWPWLLVAVVTVATYAPIGNIPGIRRTVAIPVVAALLLGAGLDVLRRQLPKPAVRAAVTWVAAAAIIIPIGIQLISWQNTHYDRRPVVAISVDFPFPLEPGMTMPETLDSIADGLRSGTLTDTEVMRRWPDARVLAMIRELAEHRNEPLAGIPSRERILDLFYQSPGCYPDSVCVR
jgi:hypothetical protein